MTSALLLLALAALGHHSHSAYYDACTNVTIQGRIDSMQWKNPHVLIDLTTDDGKAYRADWTSAGALERDRIAPPNVGERVVITGRLRE